MEWASNGTTFTTETGLRKINYDRMVSFGEIGKTLKAMHNTYASSLSDLKPNGARIDRPESDLHIF